MGNQPYFSVSRITKQWTMKKVFADFSMMKGEALAIVGPSGCGKSSVLRIICGLLSPDSGAVFLDGEDITSLPPSHRGIGMVFQDSALFTHLSVEDNIGYGLISIGKSKKESRREALCFLERFGLSGFQKRKIESLSGGEKQRVALARTLIINPRLVLFDEPLSSLDADLRSKMQEELCSRQKEFNYTAIYVTHDIDEARRLSDRMYRME